MTMNGWSLEWLDIAAIGCKWLDKDMMAGHGCKWLEIAGITGN